MATEQTKDITDMKAEGASLSPGQAGTLANQQQPPPPYLAQAPPPPPLAVQPAQPYAQPQVVMTMQGHMVQMAPQPVQVATQQPTQVIVCVGDLGDAPTMTTCRNCGQRVQTRVVYHSGAFTWLICGLCILFGLVFGCCVIPFFMDVCKDAHHFCPSCNVNLCVHKKL